ncbi:MAG: carboxypeptidase regulatory-like domain-containing protein [Planctomycetota bacterium]
MKERMNVVLRVAGAGLVLVLGCAGAGLLLSDDAPTSPPGRAPEPAVPAASPRAATPAAARRARREVVAPAPRAEQRGAARARELRVVVRDAVSGAPIDGARVAVRATGTRAGEVLGGETGQDGAAALPLGALEGELEVMAVAEGWLVGQPVLAVAGGEPVEVALAPGGAVHARVRRADGQQLPQGVEVVLEGADERFFAAGSGRPDAAGEVLVRGVPAGEGLALVASCPGFAPARVELPSLSAGGAVYEAGELRLQRLAVEVEVRPVGALAIGADLRLERWQLGSEPVVQALAGDRAEVSFAQPGEGWVRALQEGAASPWTRVETGGQGEVVRLSLAALAPLSGQVVDAAGQPIAKAEVVATDPAERRLRATTDEQGRFALRAASGELFAIEARAAGASARLDVVAPEELRLVLVARGAVTARAFVGPGGAAVRGALSCDPGGVSRHEASAPAESFEAAFDERGVPALEALEAGTWTLSFLEPAKDELRAWVREVSVAPGKPLDLSCDTSAPRGRVTGRVLGAPRQGLVQVDLRPAGAAREGFVFLAARPADPSGDFAFPAVPPGRYVLRASWDGGDSQSVEVEVSAGAAARAELPPS